MFDLGWDEMALIAVVALVVLGPKELPNALRTVSGLMKQARKLASEFQNGMHEIIREAELEDAKKAVQDLTTKGAIANVIEKTVDPSGELKSAFQKPEDDDKPALTPPSETKPDEAKPIAAVAGPSLPAAAEIKPDQDAKLDQAGADQAEINPAVAAFGPNGTGGIHAAAEAMDEEDSEAAALRQTPIETISHASSTAPVATAATGPAASISPDTEKSKTS